MSIIDAVIAYKFVKIVSTPFEKTDAFKLGIIDKKGNVLIPRTKLKTNEQKKLFGLFSTERHLIPGQSDGRHRIERHFGGRQ